MRRPEDPFHMGGGGQNPIEDRADRGAVQQNIQAMRSVRPGPDAQNPKNGTRQSGSDTSRRAGGAGERSTSSSPEKLWPRRMPDDR